MNISIELNVKDLRAMAKMAAKNDIRKYLEGVCLELGAVESKLIATNGHMLGVLRVLTPSNVTESQQVIIPLSAIAALPKPKGKYSVNVTTLTIEPKAENGTQFATFSNDETSSRFLLIDGTYPGWKRIVRIRTISGEVAQFDTAYLAMFSAVAKELGISSADNKVCVSHNGEGPALIRIIGLENFFGVLMALHNKVSPLVSSPDWLNDEPSVQLAIAA
jgi:DNA polymerase-3 subunit beta